MRSYPLSPHGSHVINYIGRQSGFGLTEDLDLYNVAPVNTTICVPAGSPVEAAHELAAEVLGKWKEGELKHHEYAPVSDDAGR